MKVHRARQCHAESGKQQQYQQKMNDYCLRISRPSPPKIKIVEMLLDKSREVR